MIMLAVRFVIELVAFGGIGLAGWRIGAGDRFTLTNA
jgi:hypothetical protein